MIMAMLFAGQVYADRIVEIQGAGATDDAYVDSFNNATTYNGGSIRLKNYSTSVTCWGLVKFELPTLNPGEYVSDAAMTFDYFSNDNTNGTTMAVTLHRLVYSWTDTQVTWDSRMSGTPWLNGNIGYAGSFPSNYSPTVLGTVTLTQGVYGLVTFQSPELTAALDQMIKGKLAYHGFLLNTGRNYGPWNNSWYFASSDRADQVKPKLTLTISSPEPVAAKPYPLGWYDSVNNPDKVVSLTEQGANMVLPYSGSTSATETYVQACQAAGLNVILKIPAYYLLNQDVLWIRQYVKNFDAYPAVYGWEVAEEPAGAGLSVALCEFGYTAIRLESAKPVSICFTGDEINNNAPAAFVNAFDAFTFDMYPFLLNNAEFAGLSSWVTLAQTAEAQSLQLGKPWWATIQGIGQQPDVTFDKRLPTYTENKFMVYWPVLNGAQGVLSWTHYRAMDTLACPTCPYPYDGQQWLQDVWTPAADEFALHGTAVQAGPLSGAVSDDSPDILSAVYRDPESDDYYLIALNSSGSGKQAAFTLAGLPGKTQAVYVGETGSDKNIVNASFTDTFSAYQVHAYLLVTPGDADGDGDVDMLDFALVAANYQLSVPNGASDGDFDGDGDVDLNDLHILAAHWCANR